MKDAFSADHLDTIRGPRFRNTSKSIQAVDVMYPSTAAHTICAGGCKLSVQQSCRPQETIHCSLYIDFYKALCVSSCNFENELYLPVRLVQIFTCGMCSDGSLSLIHANSKKLWYTCWNQFQNRLRAKIAKYRCTCTVSSHLTVLIAAPFLFVHCK